MGGELDNFMVYIEGWGEKILGNYFLCFIKNFFNELELEFWNLVDNCKMVKVCCENF